MWQLSFSDMDEVAALALKASPEDAVLREALGRTAAWFSPVQELIRGSVPGETWATPLYDREPMAQWRKGAGSRVTVLGDACHPMAMFKGQGANQALEDAPLLAAWLGDKSGAGRGQGRLTRQTLLTRLRCFEREMLARTTPKVRSDRTPSHPPQPFSTKLYKAVPALTSSYVVSLFLLSLRFSRPALQPRNCTQTRLWSRTTVWRAVGALGRRWRCSVTLESPQHKGRS